MSQLGEDVGGFARGHRLTWRGRQVEFRHLGGIELAEFERENFRQKREELREFRDDYSQATYEARLDELRARYDRNEFTLEAEFHGLDPVTPDPRSLGKVVLVLQVMTGLSAAEVWDLLREERVEVLRLFRLVLEESFPRPQEREGQAGNPEPAGTPS